jgi:hypothetical protein
MDFQFGGIIGFAILIADIYVIVKTVQSGAATGAKVLWIVVVLILPLVGFLLWLFLGPKGASAGDSKI